MDDPKLLASCGTYCGVCPYLIAYKTNNESLKQKLAKTVGLKPDQIICEGCNSDLPLVFCRNCPMKKCVNEKGFQSCAECDEFPCEVIEKFPFKLFLKRQAWDVNYRKEHGDEAWLTKTIEMNTCPSCGNIEHWRAKICKSCGKELEKRYI
jgi:ribosomal protein L32